MEQKDASFEPGTHHADAAEWMATAIKAVASGWSAAYLKQSPIQGTVTVAIDAMVRDAGELAVKLQAEARRRMSPGKER